MPNVASVLKSEIARVARKEVRAVTDDLKKHLSLARKDIALLKRQLAAAEKQVARLTRTPARSAEPLASAASPASDEKPARLRAGSLLSLRKRLGLSQSDMGRLVGASSLSIYKWETGQVQPRRRYVDAIAALRALDAAQVADRLAEAA